MSSSEDWSRIKRLFEQAADLTGDARAEYLDREAGADPELRARVEELLRADREAATGFLEPAALGDRAAPGGEDAWPGRTFGRYRVERELGRGGMGVVFLAHRADGRYEREVALKVVPAAPLQPYLAERFRSEVRILAALDHPYVARLLDAGETDDGLAYLVMEYVDGPPIDGYADAHRLDLPSRLRLFRRVLEGVDFAHRHGIVHRDLKPSNILVNRDGNPKLVDFGIAKLLEDSGGAAVTRTRQRMLTPDYASPEQLRGDPVDTRSDVYSLGVVLFRLLTGRAPDSLAGAEPGGAARVGVARVVREEQPALPSDGVPLRGDLDTIVHHAMVEEPEGRYGTVVAFGDDIDRYLDGRPVQARNPGLLYRARRFVRRRRVALGAAAVVAAVALTAAWQATEAARQRRTVAANSAELTGLVRSVLTTLNTDLAGEDLGPTATRVVAVEAAVAALDTLASRAGGRPSDDLLEALANAYQEVGMVQGHPTSPNVGRPDDAMASFQRALAYWHELAESDPSRTSTLPGLAKAHVLISDIHWSRGHNDAAAAELDRAEAIMEAVRARPALDETALGALGMVYQRQARLAEVRGDLQSMVTYVEHLSDVTRRSADAAPEGAGRLAALEEVVLALQHESYVRSRTGDLDQAIVTQREAAQLADSLAERPGSTQRMASIQAEAWNQLGWRYNDADRPDEAVAAFDRALDRQRQLRASDPGNQAALGALGQYLAGRGQAYIRAERWEAALADQRESIELLSPLSATVPAVAYIVTQNWRQVGEALAHLGRFDEAHEAYERSLEGTRELREVDPAAVAPRKLQALAYYSQGVYYRLRARDTGDPTWCAPAAEAVSTGSGLWNGLREQGQVFPGEQRIWEDFGAGMPREVCGGG